MNQNEAEPFFDGNTNSMRHFNVQNLVFCTFVSYVVGDVSKMKFRFSSIAHATASLSLVMQINVLGLCKHRTA